MCVCVLCDVFSVYVHVRVCLSLSTDVSKRFLNPYDGGIIYHLISLSHTHTLSFTHTHTHSLSFTHTHTHSLSHTHTLTLFLTHSLYLSFSLSLIISILFKAEVVLTNAMKDAAKLAVQLDARSSALALALSEKAAAETKANEAAEREARLVDDKKDLRNRYDLLVAELDDLVAGMAPQQLKPCDE